MGSALIILPSSFALSSRPTLGTHALASRNFCSWFGESVATSYWWMIGSGVPGGSHTEPTDKPALWESDEA